MSLLQSLFKKHYGDKEDPDIMSEAGMLKFFKDCGVNPESYETLVIAYLLQCEEMGIYEKQEFVTVFADQGMIPKFIFISISTFCTFIWLLFCDCDIFRLQQ